METSIEVLLWMSIPAECNCRTDWRTCLTACTVRGSSRTPRLAHVGLRLEERGSLTEMWGLECLVSLMLDKPQTYFF